VLNVMLAVCVIVILVYLVYYLVVVCVTLLNNNLSETLTLHDYLINNCAELVCNLVGNQPKPLNSTQQ
jgi:hypothetical protein